MKVYFYKIYYKIYFKKNSRAKSRILEHHPILTKRALKTSPPPIKTFFKSFYNKNFFLHISREGAASESWTHVLFMLGLK